MSGSCCCTFCEFVKLFGLPPDQPEFCFEDVKRKYREQALRFHPDKPGGSTEKFQKLSEAYNYFKDKHASGSNFLPLCESSRSPLKAAGGGGGTMFRHSDGPDLYDRINTAKCREVHKNEVIKYEQQKRIVAFIRKHMTATKLVGKDDVWIMLGIMNGLNLWIYFIDTSPTKKEIKEFLAEHFDTHRR